MRPVPFLPILPLLSAKFVFSHPISSPTIGHTYTVDEALKLNIEDKEESSPRRPSTKRGRPAEEHHAGAQPAESAHDGGAGRPKRKAAPTPATETPVRSRGKKVKTDTAAPAAGAPSSKAKKVTEKKVSSGDDEAAKEQQEADEVDALADEPAENGTAAPIQGESSPVPFSSPLLCARISLCAEVHARATEAPIETGPNETPGGVVVEIAQIEAVAIQAS